MSVYADLRTRGRFSYGMDAFGISHIGNVRERNEDSFIAKQYPSGEWLLAVADGMGGAAAGDKASQTAVEWLDRVHVDSLKGEREMAALLRYINRQIHAQADGNSELAGMGTTLTAALVRGDNAYWAHAGDSRLYLLKHGEARQLTTDHTFIQGLIDNGAITPEEALTHPYRHVLDQCLGCKECSPQSGALKLAPGDKLLLCSDGFYKSFTPDAFAMVTQGGGTLKNSVNQLLARALAEDGTDNITLVVGLV